MRHCPKTSRDASRTVSVRMSYAAKKRPITDSRSITRPRRVLVSGMPTRKVPEQSPTRFAGDLLPRPHACRQGFGTPSFNAGSRSPLPVPFPHPSTTSKDSIILASVETAGIDGRGHLEFLRGGDHPVAHQDRRLFSRLSSQEASPRYYRSASIDKYLNGCLPKSHLMAPATDNLKHQYSPPLAHYSR